MTSAEVMAIYDAEIAAGGSANAIIVRTVRAAVAVERERWTDAARASLDESKHQSALAKDRRDGYADEKQDPDYEPVFILRAREAAAFAAILHYYVGHRTHGEATYADAVLGRLKAFQRFQCAFNKPRSGPLPDHEPVFILGAGDSTAVASLQYYHNAQRANGDTARADRVRARIGDFQRFAQEHPERMKCPVGGET